MRNEDGKAAYFFGEHMADRTYKLPASVSEAEIMVWSPGSGLQKPAMNNVDSDDFVGMVSAEAIAADSMLGSQVTFGVHRGARLDYYTMHQGGKLSNRRDGNGRSGIPMKLTAELVDTDEGVDVFVLWEGKPLVDAEVQLFCDEGHEEGNSKTDSTGKVSFDDNQVEDGLNGIMVGHSIADQQGTYNGQAYKSESHYLTMTFNDPEDFEEQPAKPLGNFSSQSSFADLPFAITSFGAARVDDAIYVYGGHTGSAHAYSTEGQSNQLLMLNLNEPTADWKKISEGERLQGLALVAHKNRLIGIGGFAARNEPAADHDLHSLSNVRAFDTTSGDWSELPSLPSGRSSHDAAILGDTIYVVGGWNMDGDNETQWHSSAWSLDLSKESPEWTELPSPNFDRRALAVVAHQGKIYAIGGMNKMGPTRQVSIFDPKTNAWTDGPSLAGENDMNGFGASGWSIDGKLVVTTYAGDIQQLATDGSEWIIAGKTKDARFFHRLLPLSTNSLIAVGGANMEEGKFLEPERIEVR
jgi:hypothetical protein